MARLTKQSTHRPVLIVLGAGLALAVALSPTGNSAHAALGTFGQPGFLGNAESFAVVAGTTVTNVVDLTPVPQTVVSGDIGLSPGTDVTGFPPGVVNNGSIYTSAVPTTAFDAQADATAAYNVIDGLVPDFANAGIVDLASANLVAGVYSADAFLLNGTLTLNGDWDDVWVFQSSSTLTTGTGSSVVLTGDANPCNVFWQLDSSATIEAGSAFVGTVLALDSIAAKSGATIEGRLLARAAVTLDHNQLSTPTCLTGPTTEATAGSGLPATGSDDSMVTGFAVLAVLTGLVAIAGSAAVRRRRAA